MEFRSEDLLVQVHAPRNAAAEEILTPDALRFAGLLCAKFEGRRQELLLARKSKTVEYDAGELPHYVSKSPAAQDPVWRCAPVPQDIQDRRVEITAGKRGWGGPRSVRGRRRPARRRRR